MVGIGCLFDIEAPVVSGGDFCPPADDTFDLGSSTRAWADGHFDGVIYTDDILEHGSGQGVTIEDVLLKDSNITLTAGNFLYFRGTSEYIYSISTGKIKLMASGSGADDFIIGCTTEMADDLTLKSGAQLIVDDTTDASSITTGSIQTDGGLGVAKKSYFGDHVRIKRGKQLYFSYDDGAPGNYDHIWSPSVGLITIQANGTGTRDVLIDCTLTVSDAVLMSAGLGVTGNFTVTTGHIYLDAGKHIYFRGSGDNYQSMWSISSGILKIQTSGTGYNDLIIDGTIYAMDNITIADGYGLVIGGASVQLTTTGFFCEPQLQVLGTDNDTSSLTIARFSNDNAQPGLRFVKSKGTTITDGTAGAVASGAQLGTVAWYGDDGTDLKTAAAQIEVNVTDTVAENQIPTKMMFSTTTTGGTRTTALTIDDDQSATFTGAVIIGSIGITGTVRAVDITTTTSVTSGNSIALEIEHTRDTDSVTGRDWGIKSTMKVDNNAKFPGGVNAVYGSLELGTGGAHGRAAGLQGELIMPDGQLTRGTFSCLHADLTESGNTNTGSAGPISFISCVGGGTLTNFDARGNLFEITGFASGSGKFYYNNTLRMLVAGATKYLPLSTTEGKFTGTLGVITASGDITLSDIKIINLKAGTSAINPEAPHRGQFYFTEGGGSVADKLYCIMKGADDNYSAIQVAIG